MIYAETNIAELEQSLFGFRRTLRTDLIGVGQDLAEEAERDAKQLMESQIYQTPERGGYERTRKLIDSVDGFVQVENSGMSVNLEAFGGAGNRLYADFVERGTRGSRVSLDRITTDARGMSELELLSYARTTGLEPRPGIIPAIAEVERTAPDRLFEAQEKAWG